MAKEGQLRDLVGLQETAPATALEAINSGRADAKMPPVPPDMLESAQKALAGGHVEAIVDGVRALDGGVEFLTDMMASAGDGVTPRLLFLCKCAAGWERAKSSEVPIKIPAIGLDLFVRLPSAKSGGEFCFIETINARGKGPPQHRHREAEIFRAIEGRYLYQVDGRRLFAEAGDVLSIPCGAAHGLVIERPTDIALGRTV